MKKLFCVFVLCISLLSFAQSKVPFVGKRFYDIVEGFSGSGTPAYYVDIKKNGDVHFGYVQVNQADGTETAEEINVGKYNPKMMTVHFKKFNETFNLKLEKDKIYLTDKNGNIQKTSDCCSVAESTDPDTKCSCESGLYES
ncbi:hypothetical protein SAMN05443633_102223 [Chryseobacterium arachidis]|uniref:Uncharacterized protein n=1 Tax=Chryseobacterium arachidis TaxID=1416778 RepID=A0A1M4X4Z7_9FLAO|nr:hypothetical protein [Chryseobacterium arachidis]SHE88521.1 hypothetical protein SAMN05443633_102223 [Chryseobacterium arachidis]